MLSNFLAKSKPINFIIISGLFLMHYFIGTSHLFLIDSITFIFLLEQSGIVFLFLLLLFLFNFILSKNTLTLDSSYAFLILVTLFGLFPITFFDVHQLLLNVLLFFFFRKIYSLKRKSLFLEKIFDAGLLSALLFIIEPFSIVFLLLIYIFIYVYQQITFKTLILPVVGFILPVFLYFSYCFYFDDLQDFNQLFYWYTNYDFEIYSQSTLWIPISLVSFFAFFTLRPELPLPEIFIG